MALALALLLAATAAIADDYDDGVSAVQAKNYDAAIIALRKAITQAPVETPDYLPHYWIGVAKFHNGDIAGALQHWALSEAQGKIKGTPQYAQMKDYIARAQSEKQKRADAEPDGPKRAAEAAMSRAFAKQSEAMGARRDRSESYRTGQRKLQEANAEFRKGAYAAAAKLASEATELFAGTSAIVPFDDVPAKEKPRVESAAKADAEVAVQSYRRRILETKKNAETRNWQRLRRELERAATDADFQRIAAEAKRRETALVEKPPSQVAAPTLAAVLPPAKPKRPSLEAAFRAYALGDLGSSEAQLTTIIEATQSAEAFLLRGCARYAKAMLTGGKTDEAAADFREALKRDGGLRLDQKAFSPKLVTFFEQIREQR